MSNPRVSRAPRSNPDHWEEHVRLAQWADMDMPQGILGYKTGTLTGIALSSTPVTIFTLSNLAVKANRFYMITCIIRAWQTAAGQPGTMNLQITANGTLITSTHGYMPANYAYGSMTWTQPYILTADTTVTFVATLTGPPSSQAYVDRGGQLRVDDRGRDRGKQ